MIRTIYRQAPNQWLVESQCRIVPHVPVGLELKKPVMICGKLSREIAKMIGITPTRLTRTGICVLWPPYCLRHCILLAYWIGIRLSPRDSRTTKAITRTKITTRMIRAHLFS